MGSSLTRKLLTALLVVSGGVGAAFYSGALGIPSAGLLDAGDWRTVSDDNITVETLFWIDNPTGIGLDIRNITLSYSAALADVVIAEGAIDSIQVPEGNTTQTITTAVLHDNLPTWWNRHLQNSEASTLDISATLDASLFGVPLPSDLPSYTRTIQTDLISMLESSLRSAEGTYTKTTGIDGAVEEDTDITIDGMHARWGAVDDETTALVVDVAVHNPNTYPLPTPEFTGRIAMNTIDVALWDANDITVLDAPENGMILPEETRNITFQVTVQDQRISDWLESHIRKNETTEGVIWYRIGFTVNGVTIGIPGDDGATCSFRFQTAIFEDRETPDSSFDDCSTAQDSSTRSSDENNDTLLDTEDNITSGDSSSDNESGNDSLIDDTVLP